jgi:hypothetical protein
MKSRAGARPNDIKRGCAAVGDFLLKEKRAFGTGGVERSARERDMACYVGCGSL